MFSKYNITVPSNYKINIVIVNTLKMFKLKLYLKFQRFLFFGLILIYHFYDIKLPQNEINWQPRNNRNDIDSRNLKASNKSTNLKKKPSDSNYQKYILYKTLEWIIDEFGADDHYDDLATYVHTLISKPKTVYNMKIKLSKKKKKILLQFYLNSYVSIFKKLLPCLLSRDASDSKFYFEQSVSLKKVYDKFGCYLTQKILSDLNINYVEYSN